MSLSILVGIEGENFLLSGNDPRQSGISERKTNFSLKKKLSACQSTLKSLVQRIRR